MSTPRSAGRRDLAALRGWLSTAGYSTGTIHNYISSVREFLRYLDGRGIVLTEVDSSHVEAYRRHRLRQYKRRNGRMPPCIRQWRGKCNGGIGHFLRSVLGDWPRRPPPRDAVEAYVRALLAEYRRRLSTYDNLAPSTVVGRIEEAERFLLWCRDRGALSDTLELSVADLDAFVQHRASGLRRVTCSHMTRLLRSFLRFLHRTGKIPVDLSAQVVVPTLYQYESIPSILDAGQVAAVLRHARKDRSPQGRRDYAILMLLATYGLRGGEVVHLQLADIDWRTDTLSVVHSKTRMCTTLPLVPAVGEALLAYLRNGRPKAASREVFLRLRAPFIRLKGPSSLYHMVRSHIAAAGVRPIGKQGSHLFRHARAVTLLRAGVHVKTISDLLGHRTLKSTSVYFKLQSEELRSVALPLPKGQGGEL